MLINIFRIKILHGSRDVGNRKIMKQVITQKFTILYLSNIEITGYDPNICIIIYVG